MWRKIILKKYAKLLVIIESPLCLEQSTSIAEGQSSSLKSFVMYSSGKAEIRTSGSFTYPKSKQTGVKKCDLIFSLMNVFSQGNRHFFHSKEKYSGKFEFYS